LKVFLLKEKAGTNEDKTFGTFAEQTGDSISRVKDLF
jgi:hypothetical protein